MSFEKLGDVAGQNSAGCRLGVGSETGSQTAGFEVAESGQEFCCDSFRGLARPRTRDG